MNSQILQQIPGGKVYNTVYPASVSQNSASGTADVSMLRFGRVAKVC